MLEFLIQGDADNGLLHHRRYGLSGSGHRLGSELEDPLGRQSPPIGLRRGQGLREVI